MPRVAIENALEKLKAEIETLESSEEAEDKARLQELVANLDDSLASELAHEDLLDEVKETLTTFEIEHPRITAIINDIMVSLSNLGI